LTRSPVRVTWVKLAAGSVGTEVNVALGLKLVVGTAVPVGVMKAGVVGVVDVLLEVLVKEKELGMGSLDAGRGVPGRSALLLAGILVARTVDMDRFPGTLTAVVESHTLDSVGDVDKVCVAFAAEVQGRVTELVMDPENVKTLLPWPSPADVVFHRPEVRLVHVEPVPVDSNLLRVGNHTDEIVNVDEELTEGTPDVSRELLVALSRTVVGLNSTELLPGPVPMKVELVLFPYGAVEVAGAEEVDVLFQPLLIGRVVAVSGTEWEDVDCVVVVEGPVPVPVNVADDCVPENPEVDTGTVSVAFTDTSETVVVLGLQVSLSTQLHYPQRQL